MKGLWRALWLAGVIQLSLGVTKDILNVTVTIDMTRKLHLTDSRFLSLSVPPSFFLTNKYSMTTKSMLQGLSPCHVRVGGPESDMLYFGSPTNVSEGATFTMRQWEMLQQLAKDSGVSLVFTANPHLRVPGSNNWDSSDILTILQFSSERGLSSTPMWQLGYVADMLKRDGSSVGRDVTRLHKALDLYPSYQSAAVLGPDFPSCISPECLHFLRDFLLQTGDVITTLVVQFNPESEQRDEEIVFEKISRLIDDVDKKIATKNVLQLGSYNNVPKKQLWIAENGAEEYTGAFTDALIWALRLGHAARLGYDVVLRRLTQLDQPTPDYWVSLLYHQLVGRAVLDIRPSSHPSVMLFGHCTKYSYSSYKPGAVTVWGINAAERAVSLKLPHPHSLMYALTARTAHLPGSTLLNGKELRLTREAFLPELQPHDLLADHVSIPAYSVFYIVLPDLMAPACLSPANLPRHSTVSYVTMIPSDVNNLLTKPRFETKLLSKQNIYDVESGGSFVSETAQYENFHLHQSNPNLKSFPTVQTVIKKQDNIKTIKLKNNQSSLINQASLMNSFTKKNSLPFTDERAKDPQMENDLTNIRLKRSEFNKEHDLNDEKVKVPSLNRTSKQNIKTLDIFKSFQQLYRKKDDEILKKSQQDLLASKENLNTQNFDSKEANIHYFPGEFYNKLRDFLSKPNERLSDIEDPHEAVASITKHASKNLVQGSKLLVTRKPSNNQPFDRKIVERATKNIENYFNYADNFLKEAKCKNEKHGGKMKCCMGKLSSTSNDHSHIETMSKTRLKRETRKIYHDQSKETPFLKQTDNLKTGEKSISNSLEEEKLSLLLKELTEEGEELLRSFDQDYERSLLEHKMNSMANLPSVNLNLSNLHNLYEENNLTRSKLNKPKENFSTTNIFSSNSQKIETSTEKVFRSEENSSLITTSSSSIFPDLLKKHKISEQEIILNKINPEINDKSSLNYRKETTIERNMNSSLAESNQLYIYEKKNSDRHELNPLLSPTNSSQQKIMKQVQMDDMKISNHSTNSEEYSTAKYQPIKFNTLYENYQYDHRSGLNNSNNLVFNSGTNQIVSSSTPTAIKKHDSKNVLISEVPKLNESSLPQLKILMQSNTTILPLYRIQQIQVTPATHAEAQVGSTSKKQSTPLSLKATNMRKQRLEELRARLENIKRRMMNLTKPKITNRNLFERDSLNNHGISGLTVGKSILITPNSVEDSHKNNFATKEEGLEKHSNFKNNGFTKPSHDSGTIYNLLTSDDMRKTNNTFSSLNNNSETLDFIHTGSRYAEQKLVLPVNPLKNYLLTEDADLNHKIFVTKPDASLPNHRTWQDSDSEIINKQRDPRSIQNPCIRDRFNDFETDEQDSRFQQHMNIQPPNKQIEVTMLNHTYEINKSAGDEKNKKNSSDTSKSIPPLDHMSKFKRSIHDSIQLNEVETTEILTDEIVKQGPPLHDVSSPDDNLFDNKSLKTKPNRSLVERLIELAKKYHKTNPSSLEIFSNNFKGDNDDAYTDHNKSENKNKSREFIDIEKSGTNKQIFENDLSKLEEFTPFKEYNSETTVTSNTGNSQDMGLGFQETSTKTDDSGMLKKNVVSVIIKRISTFFKNITSVINNLSQTKI